MREDWKEVRFGEITELIKRGIAPKYVEEGGYIVINQKCIRDGVLSFGDSRLSSKENKVAKEKFVQIGDVLINSTGTGTLGRTAPVRKLPGATTVDTHVTILRGNDKVDKLFLGYLASHYEPLITLLGKGATNQIELGASDLKVTKVVIPESKETQRKIASILSAYDDLIENNLKRIKLLEEKAQLTYEEWFVRMKFPGHETTPINEETGLPEGWEIKTLAEVTNYIGRGISPKYVENNGIPVFNQKCIRDNKVNRNLTRLSSPQKKISKEKALHPLDILVNSTGTGTLGRVAQIIHTDQLMTVDTHVTIVRGSDQVTPIFLGRFMTYNQPRIENLGKGATNQIELSRHDLGRMKVILPSMELQIKFDQDYSSNYLTTDLLIEQNRMLKEARDILLPRLMTGMIDVEQMKLENLQPTTA